MEKRTLLKKFFGHSAFRGGQEALIDAILSGRDVLGVMPTGGGKSICYQIPALMLPGLTIVVSPLISLMKDQVAALTEAGVPAAFLNSSLSLEQLRETYAKTAREQYKLLYVAPERLENESFLSLISHVPVSLLAVDEAHCISQWGQDFRPSYLKIADFIAQLPTRPVVAAFTATATKQVRADIISQLGLRNPLLNITGFDRPNLYFAVQHPTSKLAATLQLVRKRDGSSGEFFLLYLDLYQAYRPKTDGDKENINDDITFEIELIRQVEINIDYILMLVMKHHESNCKDKSILGTIGRAIDSSIQLRSKKDLIHGFINTVNAATDVDRDWQSYVQQQKQQELEQIIAEEKLKPAEAQRFVSNAFRDGALKTTGTDIDQILPPVSRFGGGNRTEKKKTIIQRLAQFFEKYFGI